MYVGAVALALTVAACSSSGSSDTASVRTDATRTEGTPTEGTPDATGAVGEVESADTAPDASAAPVDAGVVVPEALQFTAPLVGGGEFSGAAVADKPTLFWFWAPT
jgi:hypothetical protein